MKKQFSKHSISIKIFVLMVMTIVSSGQVAASSRDGQVSKILTKIQTYRREKAGEIVGELISFVKVPNNVNKVEEIKANAAALKKMLEKRGIRTELFDTPSGRPAVFGELKSAGATRTIMFYGHYDGVPANAQDWHSNPYEPVLRRGKPSGDGEADWTTIPLPSDGKYEDSWRLYGRSTADSKNAIVALLSSIDAIRAAGSEPQVNLKFFFDGEEEQESPGLAECLRQNKEKLAADILISASGEVHQSGLPTVAGGVRGTLMFELTAYTTVTELHSGHFGNFAPSAVFRLAELLASMKSSDGRVKIEGFYDDVVPLTEGEKNALRKIPAIEQKIQEQFGIRQPETAGKSLQELINLPTFNVRGLQSGYVREEARNIVPRTAVADFDVRLVKGMTPEKTLEKIIAHIRKQGWTILDREPTREELLKNDKVIRLVKNTSFPPTRTPLETPIVAQIIKAVKSAVSEPVVVEPTEGGSLALHLFEQAGVPYVITLPTSNFDCNQHTADENLHLKYFFQSIDIFSSVMLIE